MKKQYLILLDCCRGVVVKIKLTPAAIEKASSEYDEYEEFISEQLEGKYNFSLTNCSWMLTDRLEEITYNL